MISLASAMTFAILLRETIDTFFCTLCTLCSNVVTFVFVVNITMASLTFVQALVEAQNDFRLKLEAVRARKNHNRAVGEAIKILAVCRARQAREDRQRAVVAVAVKVQATFHGSQARKKRQQAVAAAVKVQAAFRGRIARKKHEQAVAAAVKIQAAFRDHKARKKYVRRALLVRAHVKCARAFSGGQTSHVPAL